MSEKTSVYKDFRGGEGVWRGDIGIVFLAKGCAKWRTHVAKREWM
jgi:hypothetical protein